MDAKQLRHRKRPLPEIDATFERVTVTDHISANAKRFVRIKITTH